MIHKILYSSFNLREFKGNNHDKNIDMQNIQSLLLDFANLSHFEHVTNIENYFFHKLAFIFTETWIPAKILEPNTLESSFQPTANSYTKKILKTCMKTKGWIWSY